jgi:imidazolonepropionase-like amidohydrolase
MTANEVAEPRMVVSAERVLLGDGTPPQTGMAIVIVGDRITAVGALAEVLQPTDKHLNLGTGTLLPGLINGHVHLTIDDADVERPSRAHSDTEVERILAASARARRCLEAGVTTVRDVGASDRGIFALRASVARGETVASRIYAAGALICATGGHAYRIGHEADGETGMRRAAREELKAGADFLKLMADGGTSDRALDIAQSSLTDDEIGAVVDVAHRLGRKVTAHAIAPRTIDAVIRGGVDAIEHGYSLDQSSAAAMAERDVVLVPTLSVHAAVLRRDASELSRVWWLDQVRRGREASRQGVGLARTAGVRIVAGTDGGSPFNPHEDLVSELELLTEAGLSNDEALHAATGAAADLLDAADDIGRIAVGRFADLVHVTGDPSADLTTLREPTMVMLGGRVAQRAEANHVVAD